MVLKWTARGAVVRVRIQGGYTQKVGALLFWFCAVFLGFLIAVLMFITYFEPLPPKQRGKPPSMLTTKEG